VKTKNNAAVDGGAMMVWAGMPQ
jgi:hypothetical protein